MKNRKTYLYSILITLAVGGLSAWLTRKGMAHYEETALKPTLTPPWVFAVAWSILYALMGISAARIWNTEASKARSRGLNFYTAQLAVNFFWSLLFFNARAYGFAALWLILLIVLTARMVLAFAQTDILAAKMQIPYLLWLAFALYLNVAVWLLDENSSFLLTTSAL